MTRQGRVEELPEALGPPPATGRLGPAVGATLLAVAALGGFMWGYLRLQAGRIGVESAWVSRGVSGPGLERVDASDGGEVFYNARLTGVPFGRALDVECEWFDGAGVTVRLNHFETRTVDHEPWPTHCRCPLDGAAPGPWRVLMSVEGRPISETAFEVTEP